eukprot:gene6254-10262_t
MFTRILVLLALIVASAYAKTCYANGDPHYRSFAGRAFNWYGIGKTLLFKRGRIACYTTTYRSKQYGTRSLNGAIHCRAGRHTFAVKGNKGGFHGKLKTGRTWRWAHKDVRVTVTSNRLREGRYYLNIAVQAKHVEGAKGLCTGNIPKQRPIIKRPLNPVWVKIARSVCKKAGFRVGSFDYKSCVTDVARTHKRRIAGQLRRFEVKIGKNYKRVCSHGHCRYFKFGVKKIPYWKFHTKRIAYRKKYYKTKQYYKHHVKRYKKYFKKKVPNFKKRRHYAKLAKKASKKAYHLRKRSRYLYKQAAKYRKISKTAMKTVRAFKWAVKRWRTKHSKRVAYWKTHHKTVKYRTRHHKVVRKWKKFHHHTMRR